MEAFRAIRRLMPLQHAYAFLHVAVEEGLSVSEYAKRVPHYNYPAALIMLNVAALVEIIAYYIVVDNLLDSLATPAAFIAGTVVSAAVMTDVPPMVKWTAAVIAEGGIAGLTQGVTAILRAHSTAWTGGLGNSVIATAELGGALLTSLLALAIPAAAIALVILFLWLAIRFLHRFFRGSHSKNSQE